MNNLIKTIYLITLLAAMLTAFPAMAAPDLTLGVANGSAHDQ